MKYISILVFLASLMFSHAAMAQDDDSYLLIASGKGKLDMVNAMLGSGANPNVADKKGVTALMYATRKNRFQVISTLIEKGAEVNTKDKAGWTALMVAIKKNHVESASLLLEKGADPHVVDPTGWNALNLAALDGSTELVKGLLDHGVDVNDRNVDKKTALMMAAKGGKADTIELLIEYHANLTVQDHLGTTALMYAAREGNAAVISRFAQYFAKLPEDKRQSLLDQEDGSEWTALTWAVKKGQLESAVALIDAGADLNHKDSEGTPILHVAVSNDDQKMVDMLLARNVDVKAKDKYGLTALVYALKDQHTEIAKKIKAAGGHY